MQIEQRNIAELIPYEFNSRTHGETQIDRIANSIQQFGFNQPIVVDEQNVVLVGHGRLLAAKKLGLEFAPVLQKIGLTETQKKAYRVLDNKLQNDSSWSFENLELDLGFLEDNGFSLEDWGLGDLQKLLQVEPEVAEDDFEPVICENEETFIKRGDLVELGRHRLLCGDCTNTDDVNSIVGEKHFELLFTSPPYSDMRTYGDNASNLEPEHIAGFITAIADHCSILAVNLGLKFSEGALVPYWDYFLTASKEAGLKLLAWNVWEKEGGATVAAACAMFFIRHEFIFVFGEQRKKLNRTVKNKTERSDQELLNGELKSARQKNGEMKIYHTKLYNYRQLSSVTQVKPNPTHGEHVATFPIELPAEYMKALTNPDDFVFEPFSGSGTTLIACEQLNRTCYGMEIEPKYCEVIIQRYKKYCESNSKPFECKVNGQPYAPIDRV